MKNILALLFLLPLYAYAQHDSVCVLHGHIDGLGSQQLSFSYHSTDLKKPYVTKKVKAHDGDFTYTVHLSEPTCYNIYYYKKNTKTSRPIYHGIEVFLENGNMTMTGTLDSLNRAKISGSTVNDELTTVKSRQRVLSDSLYRIASVQAAGDSIRAKNVRLSKDAYKLITDLTINYISAHPHSYVSAQMLYDNYSYTVDPSISQPLYNSLDEQMKATVPAILYKRKLDTELKTNVGMKALDIKLPDQDGKDVSLSSTRGHVTLLDFWASWCGPCRRENPNVVKAYTHYHDKGFDIYSVSLDQNKKAWLDAIRKDSLTWTHVSDLKGWKSSAALLYGVQGIPANVLIDRDGTILAKNLREDELEKKLEEIFRTGK